MLKDKLICIQWCIIQPNRSIGQATIKGERGYQNTKDRLLSRKLLFSEKVHVGKETLKGEMKVVISTHP